MPLKLVDRPSGRPHINVLLFGKPKTGKTAGACTAPGGVLLLNTDTPNATWFARSKERDPDGQVMEVRCDGLATLVDVTHAVESNPEADGRIINTLVLDNVGQLHQKLLDESSNNAVRPTLSQYGDTNTYIERFCRHMVELPVNFVIVCHELETKDEATGAIERRPLTGTSNPTLGTKLMGMVDIVGYTGVIEQEDGAKVYAATLRPTLGRMGGDRFDVLGDWRALDLTEWADRIAEKTGGGLPNTEQRRAPARRRRSTKQPTPPTEAAA